MTMVSSSIWKGLGLACRAAAQIAAPVVSGTAAIIQGAVELGSGVGHLTAQIYRTIATAAGAAGSQVGSGANYLANRLSDFTDNALEETDVKSSLDTIKNADNKLTENLKRYNDLIYSSIGGAGDLTLNILNEVEKVFRGNLDSNLIKVMFTVMMVAFGLWTLFQNPKNADGADDRRINALFEKVDDRTEPFLDDSLIKQSRVIPRPKPDLVYQYCMNHTLKDRDPCVAQAKSWSGVDEFTPSEEYSRASGRPRRKTPRKSVVRRSARGRRPSCRRRPSRRRSSRGRRTSYRR